MKKLIRKSERLNDVSHPLLVIAGTIIFVLIVLLIINILHNNYLWKI